MKVEIQLRNGNKTVVDMLTSTQLTPHFKLAELANNNGNAKLPQFIINNEVDIFLQMLEEFRLWFNKPMKITSCYRQKEHNASVGGDSRSAHLRACAVDWWMPNHTASQRKNVQDKWADICFRHGVIGAINLYTNGYHLEAFSNKWYGNNTFKIREYRGKKGDW